MLLSSSIGLLSLVALADPSPGNIGNADGKPRVLVLDLQASDVDAQQAKLINGLVTDSMSRFAQFDVVSSDDLRHLVDVEAAKHNVGCDDASCLADLAGAMGARWVVFGNIGRLGKLTVLTLSLFDTAQTRAVGRKRAEALEIESLPAKIDEALSALMGEPAPGTVAPPPPPPSAPMSPMLIGGGIAGGVGAVGTIAFGAWALALDGTLGDAASAPAAKEDALNTGPLVVAATAGSALLAVGGAGVAAASLFLE